MKKLISLLLACCMLLSLSAAFAEDKVELTAFQYALENQKIGRAHVTPVTG